MTEEQIKQIERILTGYKFLGTSRFGDSCYVFRNKYSHDCYIAFSTNVKMWYSYSQFGDYKGVMCLSPDKTRQINKIINDVLGW